MCDVFLSHNSQDKPFVEALAKRLEDKAGLSVWLDKWQLIPGEPWQEALEAALDQCQTYVVCLGGSGLGPWHNEEIRLALRQRVSNKKRRVIPVLLLVFDNCEEEALLAHPALQGRGSHCSPTKHDLDIGRTFALSYDRLEAVDETDALALALLGRAACFAPGEPIPQTLLAATIEAEGDEEEAGLQREDALHRLEELGLIEIEAGGLLILHRLLVLFVQATAPAGAEAQAAVEAAMLQELERRRDKAGYIGPLPLLQVHLRHVADATQARGDEQAATLCNRLGYYLNEIADYVGARPYYERALAIREKMLGPNHPNTQQIQESLAVIEQRLG
jgi:hypothetical protein